MVHESWSMKTRTLYISLYLYMNKIEKNRYELERTILHSSIEYSNLIGSLVFWQAMNHLILPILLIRYFNTRKNVFFNGNLKMSIFREKRCKLLPKNVQMLPKYFKQCGPKIKLLQIISDWPLTPECSFLDLFLLGFIIILFCLKGFHLPSWMVLLVKHFYDCYGTEKN